MSITLHIERLVLEGLPVASNKADAVQAVVQAELARLLLANGLAPGIAVGGAIETAAGSTLTITPGVMTDRLGADIAGAVYSTLGVTGSMAGAARAGGDQRGERI